jgi:hypothetical protein
MMIHSLQKAYEDSILNGFTEWDDGEAWSGNPAP